MSVRHGETLPQPSLLRREVKRKHSTLIIGCGNRLRGDDGVGIELAVQIKKHVSHTVTTLSFEGEPIALLNLWEGFGRVVIIDATRSGVEPGTLHCFKASERPLPTHHFGQSTHAFDLSGVIELARTLGRLPEHLTVYGIEGASFTLGTGLSDLLSGALPKLVSDILTNLNQPPFERKHT